MSRSGYYSRSIISISPPISAILTGSRRSRTRTTYIRRFTALTGFRRFRYCPSTSRPPTLPDFRRASSGGACSSCTAADSRKSASNIPEAPSKPCSTGSRLRRSSKQTKTAGSSPRRCSGKESICGCVARENMSANYKKEKRTEEERC